MSKRWFKARSFGWGWTPITWEGWLAVGLFVALVFAGTRELQNWLRSGGDRNTGLLLFLAWVGLLSAGLIAIGFVKGERPRWRWGADDPD